MALFKMRSKVRIYFKSGNTLTFKCKSFKVYKNSNVIESIEWVKPSVNLMFLKIEQIESIVELT